MNIRGVNFMRDLKQVQKRVQFGLECYEELLNCFERVGIEIRFEIDRYFSRFK